MTINLKSKIENLKWLGDSDKDVRTMANLFILLICTGLFAGHAFGAQRNQPVRIGVLTDSWGPTPGVVGLRDGLHELGYKENKNFVIGVGFTQGDAAALPEAARKLVQQGVDILFTNNPAPAKAAHAATNRVPIVFYGAGDPIGLGLIKSFARPGGNITGITDLDLDLDTKRLEIFKELVPAIKRVVFPYDSSQAFATAQAKNYRDIARHIDLVLIEKPVRTQKEAAAALANILKNETHGIVVPRSLSFNIPGLVLEAASERGIPAMFFTTWYVDNGGFASYGSNYYESGRMAARQVDKIIKGVKPADIPVEVNQNIEFVVNLKVANAMGIKIAPQVLSRANR